ncbi:MAG: LLM class flavin-dependent oxidoreductase [Sphingomonadaceae bacterium]|nr:LLM class flavin-dependent oxidoreductase [Sphingomonadaceae bacterium]
MQFHLFLPQMRLSLDRMVEIAHATESAGFNGMAGMDHLLPPLAHNLPMFDAMVTNAWIAARTTKLKVGSLVLCDAMRHPAVLAREAITLDHASKGRFELGIGWGSYQTDFDAFGLTPSKPRDRVRRLRETLEILTALWSGETIDYEGEFNQFSEVTFAPTPLSKIPILIGGGGPKTMELVREFADWWNLDVRYLDQFEGDAFQELKAKAGKARVSTQEMVAYIPKGGDRAAITEVAMRRFGHSSPVIGTGEELLEHFRLRSEQGVERSYVWFCDFGDPETLAGFGEEVVRYFPSP